ncbi:Rabconnectin [Fasciola hepatica]|uniref:Rabconnectin n=1 Tax=Fasciola hepatica TaxID=6192 RepID=A0A2H1CKC5_FASHE|nr:Rabconnectin [Fasciola hepatica]
MSLDGSVINNLSSFENLYPELVEEERKQVELEAKKALALSSTLPRRWILRRLHLDPDFGDSQFHATSVDLNDWINSLGLAGPGTASDDDLSENEEFDDQDDTRQTTGAMSDSGNQRQWKVQSQWAKGDSYSWRLLRLGLMQLAKRELDRLVQLLDFGSDDLAVYAPGLVTATRLVDTWMVGYRLELTAPPALTTRDLTRGNLTLVPTWRLLPPVNFLPGLDDSEMKANGLNSATEFQSDALSAAKSVGRSPSTGATRAMLRLRQLTDSSRTPFQTRDPFSLPTKRLWCYLVRQPLLDDLFMRHIFREPRLIQSPIIPKQSILNGTPHAGAEDDEKRQGSETHGLTLSKSGLGSSATNLTVVGATADESPKSSIGKTARSQPVSKQSGPPNRKSNALLYDDAIRLVHKEQDRLIAMCVSQANYSCIAIATPKEVIELDVDNLVTLPAWYVDEAEYDLELMRRPQSRVYPEGGSDDFIVIDSHLDAATGSQGSQGISSAAQPTTSTNVGSGGSGANVILKRTLQAVYSLASHPALPYYLCGTGTGSVHLFEWATAVPVVAGFTNTYALTSAGASGHFPAGSRGARVTAMNFDRSGRRFGCGDADGNFGLWNIQTTASDKPPYFRCNCHAKSLADFCFVGSSTLIATVGNGGGVSGEAGSSSHLIGGMNVTSVPATTITVNPTGAYLFGTDASNSVGFGTASSFGLEQNGANLALWDSLLPPHRCGVIRVTDPELECPCTAVAHCVSSLSFGWPNWSAAETPSSAHMPWTASGRPVMVAPRDRVVVVGTKRGDVCFVDLRKPSVLHSFNAHESSAIRTLCVDQASDCLTTGSADGNLKIWRLSVPELIASFSGNIHHQGRGAAAAVAAAALFRGNQSAAIIAATHVKCIAFLWIVSV